MKFPQQRPRPLRVNLTPLIDITFLLIVFFVMSNRLIREEVAMELQLPREQSGEMLKEDDEKGKIIINVTSAGEYYYGARKTDLDGLRERLKRERSRATRELSVRIRADRSVPYGMIEPVLVMCAETGFPDVSFAVAEGD